MALEIASQVLSIAIKIYQFVEQNRQVQEEGQELAQLCQVCR